MIERPPAPVLFLICLPLLVFLFLLADARAEPTGKKTKPSPPAKRAASQSQDGGESLDQQIARLKAKLDKVIADARAQGGRADEPVERGSKTEQGQADEIPPEMAADVDMTRESSAEPTKGERQGLRARLLGATPEERARREEERKRLSAAASAFGTDPTAIISYYQLTYGHTEFTNHLRLDVAAAEARLALTPNLLLRITVPYVWADLNGPRGFTVNGLGDMIVRLGGRVYASPNLAVFIGGDATFPTATEMQLGTGKYTLGPGGAVAVPMAKLSSLLYVLIQDFNSVGGDPSRRNIHFMQVQTQLNTIWSERWWTIGQMSWAMDWNQNRKTTMNLQGELGYALTRQWNVFAGGGAGVVGQDTFLGVDWNVNVGVRLMVPGTLFSKQVFEDLPKH